MFWCDSNVRMLSWWKARVVPIVIYLKIGQKCVCLIVCLFVIDSLNSQPIELGMVPIDSKFYRKCPEQKKI